MVFGGYVTVFVLMSEEGTCREQWRESQIGQGSTIGARDVAPRDAGGVVGALKRVQIW